MKFCFGDIVVVEGNLIGVVVKSWCHSLISDIEVIYITDILCESDREAVNIVVDTDLGREDVIKLFRDYEKEREAERKYQCEGCVQKTLKED